MIVKFRKFYPLLPILFLVVMSIVVLYRDPFNASNLDIVPDSVEYALAAHHFAFAGEYKILVDGQWLPPRYPPWFSVLILAPTYIVLGPEIGNAIYPITIFGIAGIVLAFLIGKKIGGDWGVSGRYKLSQKWSSGSEPLWG